VLCQVHACSRAEACQSPLVRTVSSVVQLYSHAPHMQHVVCMCSMCMALDHIHATYLSSDGDNSGQLLCHLSSKGGP
jgi:hypothetical protein